MIALRPFHRAELHPPIARPVTSPDRRVGVLLSAPMPSSRQARGIGASVSAYLLTLLHRLAPSVTTVMSHGGLTECGQLKGAAGG